MESSKLLKKSQIPALQPRHPMGLKTLMRAKTVSAMKNMSPTRFIVFFFTSFSGHRPAQREYARTGLIGPMQGASPTQSHNL